MRLFVPLGDRCGILLGVGSKLFGYSLGQLLLQHGGLERAVHLKCFGLVDVVRAVLQGDHASKPEAVVEVIMMIITQLPILLCTSKPVAYRCLRAVVFLLDRLDRVDIRIVPLLAQALLLRSQQLVVLALVL